VRHADLHASWRQHNRAAVGRVWRRAMRSAADSSLRLLALRVWLACGAGSSCCCCCCCWWWWWCCCCCC
jgi:hypothetical protein